MPSLDGLWSELRGLGGARDPRLFGREQHERVVLGTLLTEMGVTAPPLDDLTATVGARRGRILAVRWDLSTGEVGFKQPVLAATLLLHLWRRQRSPRGITTLIDGGNVNTCLALGFLAERLDIAAEHVFSRQFPMDVRQYMQERSGGRVRLIEAPTSELGREREFYAHLFHLMREVDRRRTQLCLWHAKYSGLATSWMGWVFAQHLQSCPDDIVLCLGSGSTLEGYALPVKARFGSQPRIIVAEHELSPLLAGHRVVAEPGVWAPPAGTGGEYRRPPATIPHAVLGPHYDDVNPLLTMDVIREVDGVVRYSDPTWQESSRACRAVGLLIGNSSAANIAVAKCLAEQGRTVLTFVYEPLRAFYLNSPTVRTLQSPLGQAAVAPHSACP